MADNDTIADIIAEMRRNFADGNPYYAAGLPDRLEAAHRRERGNAAKLREAVKAVVDVGYPHNFQREAPHIRGYCYDITRAIEKCFAALSAPPRNCDVGSAEGQYARFVAVCHANVDLTGRCRESCPFRRVPAEYKCDRAECYAEWAQMPYEEGGAR